MQKTEGGKLSLYNNLIDQELEGLPLEKQVEKLRDVYWKLRETGIKIFSEMRQNKPRTDQNTAKTTKQLSPSAESIPEPTGTLTKEDVKSKEGKTKKNKAKYAKRKPQNWQEAVALHL